MTMEHQRMMDGTRAPTEIEITDFIGASAKDAWLKLTQFFKQNYDTSPEVIFDRKQGWDVRYRKRGRTLITLTPETGAARVLMVLGREESEKAHSMRNKLSPKMSDSIESTKQLHDGRWLWIRLFNAEDVEDLEKLLPLKRKPKKRAREQS